MMINDMNLPEKGEGCRCKGKTPQTFSSSSSSSMRARRADHSLCAKHC